MAVYHIVASFADQSATTPAGVNGSPDNVPIRLDSGRTLFCNAGRESPALHFRGVVALMSILDSIMGMFGKKRSIDANVAANRARQANLHGQGAHQTAEYEANTRQKMEEELDQQRVDRAKPPAG